MKPITPLLFVACTIAYSAMAQSPATPARARTADANNTARNAGDANKPEATADGQGNSQADLKLVQAIRKEVMDEKSLSLSAKNCKIIVNDGSVLLRGPVENQKEKDIIAAIAKRVAGKEKVTDSLEVKMASK